MGNPIGFNELFDKAGVDAGFNELIKHYKDLEKTAKKTVKEIQSATKDIIPTSKGAAEAISQQSTSFKAQKKVVNESQKAIKALTTAQNKLRTAQSKVGIETAKVRDAITRQNRLTKQEITLNRSKQGSMVAISAELALNKQRYRDLSAAQRANVNIGGRLLETIKRQDSEIKKLDSTIGNSQRKVGGYADAILEAEKKLRGQETQLKQNIRALKIAASQTGRNTKEQRKIQLELSNTRKRYGQIVAELRQYNQAQDRSSRATRNLTNLLGALGLAGGITLVVRGVREMIGVFSGFEKQMAKVRAISGATDAEFKLLTDDAKRLGESTEKTATQVGELQLAFARVGLTTPQIIAATEATLDLSTAIDEDLALSAEVAAKTVKGFNLTAEETARVTDVMALAISSSALTLTAFQDSMKTVAPVALAVNSTLESTTAILSTLVDAGQEASTAGTSLRNIFIELAIQGLTWDEAMQQVRDSTNKVATATELFGKRASTAALIIANNSEKIDTLTTSYENAAGSAKVMADIMRDVLTGDVDIATSAIQGLVIEIGEKLTPILRSIVQGFTFFIRNIGAFIKVILIATSAIVGYRLAIKLTTLLTNQSAKATILKTLVEKASAIGQKILRGALLLTAAAQALMTGNVKRATVAMRIFNTVTKLNPLGLLLGILGAVTTAFFAYRDSTDEATKAQEEFTGKHKEFLDQLAQEQAQLVTLFDAAITAKEGTEERSFAIGEINKLYGEYLPNLLTEASTLAEIAAASDIASKALLRNLSIKFRQAEITEANTKLIKAQREATDFITQSTDDSRLALVAFNDIVRETNEGIQQIEGPPIFRTQAEQFRVLLDFAQRFDLSADDIVSAFGKIQSAQKNAAESIADTKVFYDQFIDALGLTKTAVDDTEDALKSLIKIQEKLLEQAKLLPETTERELVVKNRKIKAINTEIKRLKALGIEQGKQIDLDKIRQQIALARARNLENELNRVKEIESTKFKIRKENLEKERDALIRQGSDRVQTTELFENLITELTIEHQRVRLEKLRAVRIKNEKETNADILKELETFFLEQGMTEEDIANQLLETKLVLLQKEIAVRKDIGAEIIDQELEVARLRRKIADKELEEQKNREKELRELRDFGINSAIEAIQKRADEAIEAANDEVSATETQISKQEALAAQGLENSLKVKQKARAEALLAKLEAEKQKERAEKISAFWNLLSNSDSVQEAIAKFGIGEAFARTIEALPGLEEGGPTPDKESIIRVSEGNKPEYVVRHGPAQDYLPQLRAMNAGTYNDQFNIDNLKFTPQKMPVNDNGILLLVAETKGMRKDVRNLIPNIESAFDAQNQAAIITYKYMNRTKRVHYKYPRL